MKRYEWKNGRHREVRGPGWYLTEALAFVIFCVFTVGMAISFVLFVALVLGIAAGLK